MEYIKPKNLGGHKVKWNISTQTSAVVKYYAEYTGYTEDEIVDMYLMQLRDDPDFKTWLSKKRRNVRAMSQIYKGKEDVVE